MLGKRKFFITLYLILLTALSWWGWRAGYVRLLKQEQQQLALFTNHLESQLRRFDFIPKLLSDHDIIIAALRGSTDTSQLRRTNEYLASVNATIGGADTYLIDLSGTTIAASNWQQQSSFIGENFAFRPYFQEAALGKLGRYFALGTASGKRGYYFSAPVFHTTQVIGVIVVKMDLSQIEQDWTGKNEHFLVTDADNIIFIANRPAWLLHSLGQLSAETLTQIGESRRYGDITIGVLPFSGDPDRSPTLLRLTNAGLLNTRYMALSQIMPEAGWTVRVFAPITPLLLELISIAILLTLIFLLLYLALNLFIQRQARLRERDQFRIRAKKKLELEVLNRTSELHAEIKQKQKTEQMLRDTQKELIQAAKLALLGQLSASISHELNNPLAAIRSYADNARTFLDRQQSENVSDNLQHIISLTERMAKISSQLKFFARKSTGELTEILLQPTLSAAVDLMRPQLKASQITLASHYPDQEIRVRVNQIQLEQVIVNLLSNAIQAVENCSRKEIVLTLHVEHHQAIIQVEDSGTGIKPEVLPQLFDPFFTTKESGLGLGLSISQKIMQNMKGKIWAENVPHSGARFSLSLPIQEKP